MHACTPVCLTLHGALSCSQATRPPPYDALPQGTYEPFKTRCETCGVRKGLRPPGSENNKKSIP